MPTTSPLIESLPILWESARCYNRSIRLTDDAGHDLTVKAGLAFVIQLASYGVELDDESDAEVVRIRDSAADEEAVTTALRDLAIRRIPLAERVEDLLTRRAQSRTGSDSRPWFMVGALVALGLDLHPDDVAAHDWPSGWDEVPTHHRDMVRDLFARLDERIPDLAGAFLAVNALLSGDFDPHAAVSCPTEGEAALVVGGRDLVAADSLVAIPISPFRLGPGTGRFIIVDFETRSAFTPDDLARCQGRTV